VKTPVHEYGRQIFKTPFSNNMHGKGKQPYSARYICKQGTICLLQLIDQYARLVIGQRASKLTILGAVSLTFSTKSLTFCCSRLLYYTFYLL